MRLWSLHPKYLDSKGIVALWREALLAQRVLEGRTKGYKNHPQLLRFKELENPEAGINLYLLNIYNESLKRGYKFDRSKIKLTLTDIKIPVTNGQINYEFNHLEKKLSIRDRNKYEQNLLINSPDLNEIFCLIDGPIEEWEITI